MLLSDWYVNWKAARIKEAADNAREEGYKKGYADGKAGVTVAQSGNKAPTVTHGSSTKVTITHGHGKKASFVTGSRKSTTETGPSRRWGKSK